MDTLPRAEESPIEQPMRDFAPMIVRVMQDKRVSMRKLALATGIRRNRLSDLLRADVHVQARTSMNLLELQAILHALDLDLVAALLEVETAHQTHLIHDDRFVTMMHMISEICANLPLSLVNALNEVEGMEGTEIRREWAGPLCDGIVHRVVKEVAAIIERRSGFGRGFLYE